MFHAWKATLFVFLFSLSVFAENVPIIELPQAAAGKPYNEPLKFTATITLPFHLAITQGSLPDGLTLMQDGVVQGTPKAEGDQIFIVTLTDAADDPQQIVFRIQVKKSLVATGAPKTAAKSSVSAAQGDPPPDAAAPATKDESRAGSASQRNQLTETQTNNSIKSVELDQRIQLIGGVEQSGIASLPTQTNAFISGFFHTGGHGSLKMWGRVRLLGAPTASTGGVISAFQDPTGQIKNFDTQKVGQAVDFVFGPEIRLAKNDIYKVYAIGGIGATTPLSSQDVTSRFKVPSRSSPMCGDVVSRFTPQNGYPANLVLPDPTGTNCLANGINVLAFNNQERTSFLRKYGAGLRLTDTLGHQMGNEDPSKSSNCCGTVDFVVGQDEAITGGRLRGWVFRIDGTHTLPIAGNLLYIFGTAALRITHNKDLRTLILDPDTSGAAPSASNVALLPLLQPNKDFYRFGVGLDIMKLIPKKQTPTQNAANNGNQ